MNKLVDPTHATFIKGMYILDNVLAASEIIHSTKKDKTPGVLLKVDFEKAYDRVNWDFIQEILLSKGFGAVWTKWIISLLQGAQICININRTPTPYFVYKQGLRQGDPLSSFLFYLITDALCQILERRKQHGHIQGFGPVLLNGSQCTHFLYVDDTVFFSKGRD
jgi:Reverse transcriptase (RNA-dependent DNA polymerase)